MRNEKIWMVGWIELDGDWEGRLLFWAFKSSFDWTWDVSNEEVEEVDEDEEFISFFFMDLIDTGEVDESEISLDSNVIISLSMILSIEFWCCLSCIFWYLKFHEKFGSTDKRLNQIGGLFVWHDSDIDKCIGDNIVKQFECMEHLIEELWLTIIVNC